MRTNVKEEFRCQCGCLATNQASHQDMFQEPMNLSERPGCLQQLLRQCSRRNVHTWGSTISCLDWQTEVRMRSMNIRKSTMGAARGMSSAARVPPPRFLDRNAQTSVLSERKSNTIELKGDSMPVAPHRNILFSPTASNYSHFLPQVAIQAP